MIPTVTIELEYYNDLKKDLEKLRKQKKEYLKEIKYEELDYYKFQNKKLANQIQHLSFTLDSLKRDSLIDIIKWWFKNRK